MTLLKDYRNLSLRLTDERKKHILEHPEMLSMFDTIEQTLIHPEKVIQSLSDPTVQLYYRFYRNTVVGDKHLCVIVKRNQEDAFILTAYLTDTIKKGFIQWEEV